MHERNTRVEFTPNYAELVRKKRVCAYARVSSDKDEAFHSLSAQISYYQDKIAKHPDWEFVEVFSDRGITGTKEERPGFQAMLNACRESKIDIILAKSITRFARNSVILLETVRELRGRNIDIHFEEERIETLSLGGEFMISVLAARAQEESRSASENQKWRIQKAYQRGEPVTGNALGYRLVDHQFLIDDEEEQIVLRIFSMYLSGMGKVAIAKKLNEEGVVNRFGESKWSPAGIGKILRNEKYCGDLKLQKSFITDYISKKSVVNKGERSSYYVKNAHDPIIDRDTFQQVQEEIERRAKTAKNTANEPHSPFSKLIICGKCGKHFGRHSENAGTKYSKPAWSCLTSVQFGKEACSMGHKLPEDILIQTTCEALEIEEFDASILKERVKKIVVPEKGVLVFCFKDGSEKQLNWQHRSRRESWTPEMKEKARQRMLEKHKARKEKEEGTNGS